MTYYARPAWRNQITWIAFTACMVIVTIPFIMATSFDASAGFIAWPFALITLLLIFTILWRRYKYRFIIKDGLIECTEGIVARKVRSIRISNLRTVDLSQDFMQRLFNVGDLGFSSAGGAGIEVVFQGIKSPIKLKHQIESWKESLEH